MSAPLSPIIGRKTKRKSSTKRATRNLNDTLSDSTVEIENCLEAAKLLTTQFTQSTQSDTLESKKSTSSVTDEETSNLDLVVNKKLKIELDDEKYILPNKIEISPLIEVQNLEYKSTKTKPNFGSSFKTASNRIIQISESNFQRATKLFEDVENEEKNTENKHHDLLNSNLNDHSIKSENEHDWCNNTLVESLNSFETLSNISDNNTSINESKISDLVSTIMQGEKTIFNSTPKQTSKSNSTKKKPFRITKLQPIPISQKALKRAADLFKDIEDEFDKTLVCTQTSVKNSSSYIEEKSTLNDFDDITDTQMNQAADQAIAFDSFGDIFKEWNDHFQDNLQINEANRFTKDDLDEKGFSINDLNVAKKSVHLLHTEINKLKYTLATLNKDEISNNLAESSNLNKIGVMCRSEFQTAANNPLSINKDVIGKANKLFEDIDNEHHMNVKFNSNNTEWNRSIEKKYSNAQFLGVKTELNIQDNADNFGGFRTASNKKVNVSKTALEKVKNMFSDIDDIEIKRNEILKSSKNNTLHKAVESSILLDLKVESNIQEKADGFGGFRTASNRRVNVSKTALEKVKNMFNDIDDVEIKGNIGSKSSKNYSWHCAVQNPNLLDVKTELKIEEKSESFGGFRTASNKKVNVSKIAMEKVKNMFSDIDDIEISENEILKSSKNNTLHNVVESPILLESNVELNIHEKVDGFGGFRTASNKKVNVSKTAMDKIKSIFDGIDDFEFKENEIPNSSGNNTLQTIDNKFKLPQQIIANNITQTGNFNKNHSILGPPKTTNTEQINRKTLNESTKLLRNVTNPVHIDLDSVKNEFCNKTAESSSINTDSILFKKTDNKILSNVKSYNTEYVTLQSENESSRTTIYQPKNIKTEVAGALKEEKMDWLMEGIEDVESQNILALSSQDEDDLNETLVEDIDVFSDRDSSPGCLDTNSEFGLENCRHSKSDRNIPIICFEKPVPGNITTWKNNIDEACSKLQKQIKILKQRKTALQKQQRIIKLQKSDHICAREGYWLKLKKSCDKISLKTFYSYAVPSTYCEETMFLWKINSQNSTEINFYLPSPPNAAVIKMLEGTVLVPSLSDKAGIAELEMAFQTIPGVDIKRLPPGWFTNHFRWIIWKLSSLDRQFLNFFTEQCLTPKNVMLQLKYRYDRDIFGNERSAIRKILEKDENVGRRVVLCVADIEILSSNLYNVELTDGWYSIQSIFDYPLSKYIREGKITVGTKLITQGAELLNASDACHPLQASKQVLLKLHCNSTRRVKRFVKLGFQPNPGPMQLSLNSVITNGGMIGSVLVMPIRILPLKYLEKYPNGKWICRCQKGEKRREAQWEMSREKIIEKIHQEVYQKLQNEWKEQSKNKNPIKESLKELRVLTCSEILTNLLENSSDPQSIQQMLSKSQLDSIYEYQVKRNSHRQMELNNRLRIELEKGGYAQRSVFEIRQVIILDALKPNLENFCILEIWNPDSDVYDVLKENSILKLYNITSNSTRDDRILKTTNQTRFFKFKQEKLLKTENYKFYFSIRSMQQLNFIPPPHRYCDTIGVIIRVCTESKKQDIWLADDCQRLLKIENKFGVEICASFDGFNIGDLVAVLNINFIKSEKKYAICHLTLVSSVTKIPTHPDVIVTFIEFQSQLPDNINEYVQDCDDKIEQSGYNVE